jgi:cell division protein ZapE
MMSRIMSLSPLQRYEQAVDKDGFTKDDQQYLAMSYLDDLYHQLNESAGQKKGFFSFLKAKPVAPKGLYMWGGVGRGKTWMMDMFYD